MATSSQGEAEQGAKEVVAATPEQECSEEKREIIEFHPASGDQHVASKVEEAIRSLEALDARASALLDASDRRGVRVLRDAILRRCVDLTRMKVRGIVALLKSSYSPLQDHDAERAYHLWESMRDLIKCGHEILEVADEPGSNFPCLLNIAKRGRRHRVDHSSALLVSIKMEENYLPLEHAGCYRHLLKSSDIKLPPQVAKLIGAPLVGTDRPMNKLFRWIALRESNCSSLNVMFIVGPVGIGKTALATDLHNRLKCQATGGRYYFDCNVMAQMSRRSDERHNILLQDILSKISDHRATPALLSESDHSQRSTTMDMLVTHVSDLLQNKRYFICIDGMREALDWDKIKGAFPDNNLGSRILITTRDGSIARSCCSHPYVLVHQMKPLNPSDSERLHLTRAFGSQLNGGRQGINSSFIRLLDACGGIPLFLILLADLLKQQFPLEMWHSEESQEEAVRYEVLRGTLYHNFGNHILCRFLFDVGIPDQLVMILLSLSMFSYGYKFEKHSLIWKWMIEGVIEYDDYKEAEQYFSQLIDMNIITPTLADCKSSPDEAEEWQLHMNHFMQEFLASKSAEIGFGFTNATLSRAAASKLRRLVLRHSIPTLFQNLDLSETRSLAIAGAVDGVPLDKFVFLVVLDLEGWENLTNDVLQQVCTKMTFLQHMNVRNTQVSKIPHEIKNLCSLMVLDVSYTQISELPIEMFELEFLTRMFLRGTHLRQLPKQIVDRVHSWFLDTLDTIDLSEQSASFVKALGSLKCLKVISITWSFHQSSHIAYRKALLFSIKKWQLLTSLTIHCGLGCSLEFLSSLTDPLPLLKKFKVTTGRFASVPEWIKKLEYLSFLQITICKQGADDLKILCELGNLQYLILGLDFIPGEAIAIGNEGFTTLQRFYVDCPMPWVSFSTGAMRNLKYLQLKFRSIPASQNNVPRGIENLGSLTEVVLCYHEHYANSPSVKMTVEAVKKQVVKHLNPIDLFINDTEHDVQVAEEVMDNSVATQSETRAEMKDVPAVDEKQKIQNTCEIEEVLRDA